MLGQIFDDSFRLWYDTSNPNNEKPEEIANRLSLANKALEDLLYGEISLLDACDIWDELGIDVDYHLAQGLANMNRHGWLI